MKTILLFLVLVSCSNYDEPKYVPEVVVVNDTLISLINNQRSDLGLNELIPEKVLMELSREKAIQMEAAKVISHDGFTDLQINAKSYSQIVGYGYTYKTYNCVLFAKY